MEIKVNNPKEILGNLIYIGHTPKYRYDREKKLKTEEVEGSTIEVASDKLGKSINITSNDIALDISPFTPVELIGLTYSPYARAVSAGYAELVERFTCETIKPIGKGV